MTWTEDRGPCERCGGDGVEPDPTEEELEQAYAWDSWPVPCQDCHGSGRIVYIDGPDL